MCSLKYQLIRSSRRKTVALQIKAAKLIVRAPQNIELSYIDNFVQSKSLWIKDKVSQQQASAQIAVNNFNNGDLVYIDGLPHKIVVDYGKMSVRCNSAEGFISVYIPAKYQQQSFSKEDISAKVKLLIEEWFNSEVCDYLTLKLPALYEQTSLIATSFKVRKYKSRWGSCNNRGELSFNCLLKMLPPWVVDYVIVHELCHLKYLNHSTKFWQLVENHCPDMHLAKAWVKKNQPALTWS